MGDWVLLPLEPFWKVRVGNLDKSSSVRALEADVLLFPVLISLSSYGKLEIQMLFWLGDSEWWKNKRS